MIRQRPILYAACLAALATPAYAADAPDDATVVVTANRTSTPVDKVASSITVITAKQLQASHQTFLIDALRTVPGLYINQSGGPGTLSDIYLRGSASGDTLVLIDGVQVNDPSSTDRSFDPANLTVDNVDRIEILRGAQSTLYGSDAMAGVINIITKRGHGKPSSRLTLDGGRYGTAEGRLETSGSSKAWNYAASASQIATAGYPAAALQTGDTHNDGYRNSTLSARLDGKLSDSFRLGFTGRYTNARSNYPDFPLDHAVDNGVHRYDSEQLTARLEARWQPVNGKWEHIFGVGSNAINRDYTDQPDGQPVGLSNYNGKTYKLDWQSNYTADAKNLVTLGAERVQDESHFFSPFDASGTRRIANTGAYAQDQITFSPQWLATVGVRADDHQSYGAKATYRVTTAYTLASATRLKATYATGYKAPSLYQLYDPQFGTSSLRPESSETYDLGIEQPVLHGHGAVSATYFHSDFTNLITFVGDNTPTFGHYHNVSNASTHGVETVASYRPTKALDVELSYTYTHTQDANGNPLPRRPSNLYAATVNYQATKKLDLNLTAQYVGDRLDPAPFPNTVTLPNYALFNLAGTYAISSEYRVFARIDNLFDKKYQEIYSYAAPRRGLYGGVTLAF
jgi:vitamin B12 transporter